MGIGILERVRDCHLEELAMPDLDLIKQGEQDTERVRRYRIFDHLKTPPSLRAKRSNLGPPSPLPVEIASSRRGAPRNDAAPSWSPPPGARNDRVEFGRKLIWP
jgi:hypothetical protein